MPGNARRPQDTRVEERDALLGAQNHTSAATGPLKQRVGQLAQQQPLFILAAATVFGVLLDALLRTDGVSRRNAFAAVLPWANSIWCGLAIIGIGVTLFARDRRRFHGVFLIFVMLGGWLHSYRCDVSRSNELWRQVGPAPQPTVIRGCIDRPVVLRHKGTFPSTFRKDESQWQMQLEVSLHQIRIGQAFQESSGRVVVSIDGRDDTLLPGDELEIYGTIQSFNAPTNPGERDIRAFYRRKNLDARINVTSPQQLIRLHENRRWQHNFIRFFACVSNRGSELLLRNTSDSSGPLAIALVLGLRDQVDAQTRDELLVTGTAHLLSVSGMHLAIVVLLASRIATLLKLPLSMEVLWVFAVCVFYAALTGARPPVLRASILVGTFLLAMWMKRTSRPLNTLSFAALILVIINPDSIFNVGVQLSFLAVATLVLGGRRRADSNSMTDHEDDQESRLRALVNQSRPRYLRYARLVANAIAQAVWFSACVTAMTLPLVWYQFHVVSPISVMTNVLLGPLLFVSLAAGVATIGCGMVYEPLAILPGVVCDQALHLMRSIIEAAANVSYGHLWLPAPPGWWVGLFYVVIVASMFIGTRSSIASRLRCGWIAVWISIAWVLATTKPSLPPDSMEATFVDVGHGTCVILRFPDEQVWLYDCGWMGNRANRSRVIDEALWSLGITDIDGIILSHADSDHFNALPSLLERFNVQSILTPPGMLAENEPALGPIRAAIDDHHISVREVERGDELLSIPRVSVLHPRREDERDVGIHPANDMRGNDNANSMVVQIDLGGTCLILPGDLEPPGTEELVNQPRPSPGGILMAPHHGSLRMNAASVLQWARPRNVIVSGGRRARQPAVREMLAQSGAEVDVTANSGAIRVTILGNGTSSIQTWSEAGW